MKLETHLFVLTSRHYAEIYHCLLKYDLKSTGFLSVKNIKLHLDDSDKTELLEMTILKDIQKHRFGKYVT